MHALAIVTSFFVSDCDMDMAWFDGTGLQLHMYGPTIYD